MGIGIVVCGLNGCGKSTLGKALARQMGLHFIDVEDLYFTRESVDAPYKNPRSRTEVEDLLLREVAGHEGFVFATVKGDYGEEVQKCYQYIVVIEVPQKIRMQRVRNRSLQKFGSRMLEGGDLCEAEEQFFKLVESRTEAYYEDWLQALKCPIIRVDGTKTIEENVYFIIQQINMQQASF